MCSLFSRLNCSLILRLLAVTLFALVWPRPAFCGQIHDAAALAT